VVEIVVVVGVMVVVVVVVDIVVVGVVEVVDIGVEFFVVDVSILASSIVYDIFVVEDDVNQPIAYIADFLIGSLIEKIASEIHSMVVMFDYP
jgi:hypothetical protein